MFSLITAIITIAISVALMATAMYYLVFGPDKAQKEITAAALVAQGEQIAAAMDIHAVETAQELNNMSELVFKNYLVALPTPEQGAYQSGLTASQGDWHIKKPEKAPAVFLERKIDEETCIFVNRKTGVAGILKDIDPTRRIQCFGKSAPFTFLVNSSVDNGVPPEPECHPVIKQGDGTFVFAPGCKATWCDGTPKDVKQLASTGEYYACDDTDVDGCIANPTLPECGPPVDPCDLNPTLPECGPPVETCDENPSLPECVVCNINLVSKAVYSKPAYAQIPIIADWLGGMGYGQGLFWSAAQGWQFDFGYPGDPWVEAVTDEEYFLSISTVAPQPEKFFFSLPAEICNPPEAPDVCTLPEVTKALYSRPDLVAVPLISQWLASAAPLRWDAATGWSNGATKLATYENFANAINAQGTVPEKFLKLIPTDACNSNPQPPIKCTIDTLAFSVYAQPKYQSVPLVSQWLLSAGTGGRGLEWDNANGWYLYEDFGEGDVYSTEVTSFLNFKRYLKRATAPSNLLTDIPYQVCVYNPDPGGPSASLEVIYKNVNYAPPHTELATAEPRRILDLLSYVPFNAADYASDFYVLDKPIEFIVRNTHDTAVDFVDFKVGHRIDYITNSPVYYTHTLTHNCPAIIEPGEECNVQVSMNYIKHEVGGEDAFGYTREWYYLDPITIGNKLIIDYKIAEEAYRVNIDTEFNMDSAVKVYFDVEPLAEDDPNYFDYVDTIDYGYSIGQARYFAGGGVGGQPIAAKLVVENNSTRDIAFIGPKELGQCGTSVKSGTSCYTTKTVTRTLRNEYTALIGSEDTIKIGKTNHKFFVTGSTSNININPDVGAEKYIVGEKMYNVMELNNISQGVIYLDGIEFFDSNLDKLILPFQANYCANAPTDFQKGGTQVNAGGKFGLAPGGSCYLVRQVANISNNIYYGYFNEDIIETTVLTFSSPLTGNEQFYYEYGNHFGWITEVQRP